MRSPNDLQRELAEREDWLDHVPVEIDRAVTWLRDERTRLSEREAELTRRLQELERQLEDRNATVEAQRIEIERIRRTVWARLRERLLRRSRTR